LPELYAPHVLSERRGYLCPGDTPGGASFWSQELWSQLRLISARSLTAMVRSFSTSPHNAITTLDAAGAYIWERLQRGLQEDAVVAELARDTGTDESVIATDVREFMEQLKSRHLVSFS
jgi:hypothetical protein